MKIVKLENYLIILKTYIKIINLPNDIEQRIDNIMFK